MEQSVHTSAMPAFYLEGNKLNSYTSGKKLLKKMAFVCGFLAFAILCCPAARAYTIDRTPPAISNLPFTGGSYAVLRAPTIQTPTIQAGNVTFTNVTNTSATINWTPGNGNYEMVMMAPVGTPPVLPVNNTGYGFYHSYGGYPLGSWSVVYNNPSTTSAPVDGLTAGTAYTVMVFDYNVNVPGFTTFQYLTTAGTNNPVTLNTQPSTDAALANFTISNGTLTQGFSPGVFSYTDAIANLTSSITVVPTADNPNATITVNGTTIASGVRTAAIPMSVGANTLTIVVTAQDGVTAQTYTITVTRAPSANALLTTLKLTPAAGLTLVSGPSYANYTTSVPNTTSSITVTATEQDATAAITVNGITTASGGASAPIALAVGSNTINIVVTAQDGSTTKTYTITVTRAPSTDALLTSVKLTPAANLAIVTGPSYVNYTTSVSNATSSVTVTATEQDPTAVIKVNGVTTASGVACAPVALNVGSNVINIVSTAQDGVTTKIYTITATRAPSTDALLTSVKLTPAATLAIVTGTSYVNYTTSVANTVNSVTVTATEQDPTATITVNGAPATSGAASSSIPLNIGSNVINIVSTAQDGVTTKTYTITATRAPSTDALLTSVKLTPAANLAIVTGLSYVNYTTSVAYSTSSVTVTATEQDPTATVTVNGIVVTSGTASAPIPLSVGSNVITVVSTAQDGVTTKTYTITATRAPSTDALLTSIKLTPAANLSIISGPGYVNYSTMVPVTTSSVTVTATEQDATATLTVNGLATTAGAASAPIALAAGNNTINIVSTAQDGVTTKTYIITATRGAAPDNGIYTPISVTKPTDVVTMEDGIVVHQALSPNGDGINDYLTIDGIANYPNNSLMIVDRNGAMVYQTKGYDNSSKLFDGHSNINGKMQLPGTYFYSLDYTVNGESKHKTGYIILKY